MTDTLSKVDVGTLATWRAAGLSKSELYALVRSGQLVKVRHGAYATSGVLGRAETEPGLRHALDVAATMATRVHTGVASHHSAARLHGLRLLTQPPEGTVTLTVPPGTRAGRYRQDTGVICHAAELPDQQVTTRYGLRLTTAARTVIDIARTAPFMAGVVVADSALYERQAAKSELRRVLAGCARWPGASRATLVAEFADGLAESVLESCARVLFREHGLPPPELQVHISGPDDSGEAAIAERRRDRLLQEAGFEVIHVTWRELFGDPARVAGRIREGFRRAQRLGLPR